MTDLDGDWRALGDAVKARRNELGLTQAALARLLDGSTSNVQRIERGDGGMRLPTAFALERALGWRPGSVEDVLGGGHPTLLPERREPPRETRVDNDIGTVDAERAYEMLQAVRRVFGEEVYAEALSRAVRARMSGSDREQDSETA